MVAWGAAIPVSAGQPATATRHITLGEADDGGQSGAALYSNPAGDIEEQHHLLQSRSPAPLKEVKRFIRRLLRKLGLKM